MICFQELSGWRGQGLHRFTCTQMERCSKPEKPITNLNDLSTQPAVCYYSTSSTKRSGCWDGAHLTEPVVAHVLHPHGTWQRLGLRRATCTKTCDMFPVRGASFIQGCISRHLAQAHQAHPAADNYVAGGEFLERGQSWKMMQKHGPTELQAQWNTRRCSQLSAGVSGVAAVALITCWLHRSASVTRLILLDPPDSPQVRIPSAGLSARPARWARRWIRSGWGLQE